MVVKVIVGCKVSGSGIDSGGAVVLAVVGVVVALVVVGLVTVGVVVGVITVVVVSAAFGRHGEKVKGGVRARGTTNNNNSRCSRSNYNSSSRN